MRPGFDCLQCDFMTHASPDMQAYYAARAPYYDAVYLKPERRADLAFLSSHLPSRLAARHVLEVACGTGYWTQFIGAAAAAMVATDAVAEPLEFARLRPHTGNVRFTQADAYSLGEVLGRFDGAFAGLWFSHVPIESRTAFLRSVHARLLPGARVIFLDNSEVQCHELPIADRDALGNTYQWRELKDGSRHRVLKNFPSEAELLALVAPLATRYHFRRLDNFWLLEYELGTRSK